MLKTKIPTVRPRPNKLSDPYHDFVEEHLEELLNTADPEMHWRHYQNLLGPYAPAGTYDEVVYFLPRAFDYMMHGKDVLEEVPLAIVCFSSQNADELKRMEF